MSLLDELIGSYISLPYSGSGNAYTGTGQYQNCQFNNTYSFANDMWSTPEEERLRQKARLDETRQLTRHPSRYLTGLEPSGEILEDWDWNLMPFKWQGLDLDRFKADCEEIDEQA